jgi:hypothetical protein
MKSPSFVIGLMVIAVVFWDLGVRFVKGLLPAQTSLVE